MKRRSASNRLRRAGCVLAAVMLLASGCGSSKPGTGNLSSPPAASQYNNYAGTQAYMLVNPSLNIDTGGVWNITLDDTNKFFTYTDISIPPLTYTGPSIYPLEGATKTAGSFLKLTLNGKSSGSGGYALEIPGRLAILRPGDTTTLPVIAPQASTSACQASLPNTTFEFLMLAPPIYSFPPDYAVYGSIQASSSGTAWKFSNLQMFDKDGTALTPPSVTAGLCSYTEEGYVTGIAPTADTKNVPWTVVVGPSGYLAIDQGQGNFGQAGQPGGFGAPGATTLLGMAGFPQPASQIDTGSLVSGSYIGFSYNPYAATVLHPVTQPIAFSGGSGTVATGGLYPNDDPSQTEPGNITMDLGPQDSGTNGLYKSVTVTMPDTYNGCTGESYGGTGANGNPTCIAHGMAIAGQVEGKYVLYVALQDRSLETVEPGFGDGEIEYFLYQQ